MDSIKEAAAHHQFNDDEDYEIILSFDEKGKTLQEIMEEILMSEIENWQIT